MGMMGPDWRITVTHEPTGLTVSTSSDCFRSQTKGYDSLISRLKSKLYMLEDIEINTDDLWIVYYTPNLTVEGVDNDHQQRYHE